VGEPSPPTTNLLHKNVLFWGTNRTNGAGLAMSVDWGRPEVTG
jgi:hypothetical protein